MRLIDADALIRRWCGMKCGCERDECGREMEPCIVVMAIEEAPGIDIVRCGECKYADKCSRNVAMIDTYQMYEKIGFCSYGGREGE